MKNIKKTFALSLILLTTSIQSFADFHCSNSEQSASLNTADGITTLTLTETDSRTLVDRFITRITYKPFSGSNQLKVVLPAESCDSNGLRCKVESGSFAVALNNRTNDVFESVFLDSGEIILKVGKQPCGFCDPFNNFLSLKAISKDGFGGLLEMAFSVEECSI